MSESLTLKYRPRTIEDLVGQDNIVNTIRGMLKRKNPNQAILISGPYGSGKTTTARLIARYINCIAEDRSMDEPPCLECESCKRMEKGVLNDYKEINAANTRGIDDVRAIIDASHYKPESNYRIFVLDEAQQFTNQAQNALLKTLEEPSKSTMFIICTTDPQKILSTIISRCMKLQIDLVQPEDTVRALKRIVRGEKLDKELFNTDFLFKIASAVDGHPRDAISTLEAVINNIEGRGEVGDVDSMILDLAEKVIGETPEKVAARFLLSVYSGKFTSALLALGDVQEHRSFMSTLLSFHSHAMCWRFSPKLIDKMMFAWHAKLKEAFGEPKASSLDPKSMAEVMDIFIESDTSLRSYSVDGYYLLFNMAVKAAMACK